MRDAILGLLLTIIAFVFAACWDDRIDARQQKAEEQRFVQQEMLENTRFARELSLTNGEKPLRSLQFRGAELSGLNLADADFFGSDLTKAQLTGANLRKAVFTYSTLVDANLEGARLEDALFPYAKLQQASLGHANLNGADFWRADLTQADLTEADLTGADLTAANLTGAILTDAVVTDVCYDGETVWPDGYEPLSDPVCEAT